MPNIKNNSIVTIRKDKKKKKKSCKNSNAEIFTKSLLNVLYHGRTGKRCRKQLNVSELQGKFKCLIFLPVFFLFLSRRMTRHSVEQVSVRYLNERRHVSGISLLWSDSRRNGQTRLNCNRNFNRSSEWTREWTSCMSFDGISL